VIVLLFLTIPLSSDRDDLMLLP